MTKRKSTKKSAILHNEDVFAFLSNAKTLTNQVRAFLILAFGLNPENQRRLTEKSIELLEGRAIFKFKRAKDDPTGYATIPQTHANAILQVIKAGKLRIINKSYCLVFEEMGKDLKRYTTPPVSSMTLRQTYILNLLRRHNFDLRGVSRMAGSHINTVKHNYNELRQWEKMAGKEFREPYDLLEFIFMEG